ncbi:hypothetical protein ACSQ67_025813 [Phaseolus vulgaris]
MNESLFSPLRETLFPSMSLFTPAFTHSSFQCLLTLASPKPNPHSRALNLILNLVPFTVRHCLLLVRISNFVHLCSSLCSINLSSKSIARFPLSCRCQDFGHEVNLLVKLRHPNIVQFLGVITDRKPVMLITEYLRGVCE